MVKRRRTSHKGGNTHAKKVGACIRGMRGSNMPVTRKMAICSKKVAR